MRAHPETSPPLLVDAVHGTSVGELMVRICGELDLLTHRWLKTALDNLVLDNISSVHLQLGDLSFCDCQGMRLMIAFVRSCRLSGRVVDIESPSPIVRRLLESFDPSLVVASPAGRGFGS